jgi:hypothetical protein
MLDNESDPLNTDPVTDPPDGQGGGNTSTEPTSSKTTDPPEGGGGGTT